MAQFSPETLQKIKDRLLVSEVMSQYSTVVRRGNDSWCNCPIHGEKTPSLIIHDDKGFWHCFGCGKGGNIFTIVQEMEKCSFPEAVRILARKAGVELEEMTERERRENDKRESLYDLYNRITATFHYFLTDDKSGSQAREYLEKRHVSRDMWEKFSLGFAPDSYDFLHEFLKKRSYSDDILRSSGLFSQKKYPSALFCNRLMFPVRNWMGKCVAFSGRDLTGESKAKYLNTPETVIYSKKHNLFGIWESLGTLKNAGEGGQAIICEGNFDVVALHQSGVTCAMAPLGTAFTLEQAKILKRYCRKVTFLFDSDEAGRKATDKALTLAQSIELANEVAHLSRGKDASEVVSSYGEEALREDLRSPVSGFSHLVRNALSRYDVSSSSGKYAVFESLKPYLEATSSSIVKSDLMKSLSEVLGVSEVAIREDFQSGREREAKRTYAGKDEVTILPLVTYNLPIDLRLMLYVMNNRSWYDKIRLRLPFEDVEDREAKRLYRVLEDLKREGNLDKSNEYIVQVIEDPQTQSDVAASFSLEEFRREPERNINEALDRIAMRKIERKMKSLKAMLDFQNGDDESGTIAEILGEYELLNRQLQEMKNSSKSREG